MPRDLWRWTIAVNDIADLSTQAKLAQVDLPAPRPNRGTWEPFQAVGEALHRQSGGCADRLCFELQRA